MRTLKLAVVFLSLTITSMAQPDGPPPRGGKMDDKIKSMKITILSTTLLMLLSCKHESLQFEKLKNETYSASSVPASVSLSTQEVICKSQSFKYLE